MVTLLLMKRADCKSMQIWISIDQIMARQGEEK